MGSPLSLYRPVQIAGVSVEGNLFLAPVAGYSDRAFRSVCVDQGANLTCTELVSSEALVRNSAKTELLLKRADNERRYTIQLFGSDPDTMYRATKLLAPWAPDFVDLNCGCPVPKVVKTGAGSALMRDPDRLASIVGKMVQASREALGGVPITVKIRSGWDEHSLNYREIASAAVEAGASLVGLHARTRTQGYEGHARWEHIADLAERLPVPVIASGDISSPEAAERVLRETACAGVMFARGAMGNPFIFSETRSLLQTGGYEPVPLSERIAVGLLQLELSARDCGEALACREMRKHFCSYTKGLQGGGALRKELVHASTVAEYQALLDPFITR